MSAHTCDGTRADCLGCVAIARRHAEVKAAMTSDDRLDDVTRARIWARLDERLADGEGRAAGLRGRGRWPVAAGVLAAAAVLALIVTARLGRGAHGRLLAAPADTTLSAPIGPHTSAALVGPARLEVVGAAGDATTVRLEAGTLLASFDGGPGRALRIEAPGAVIDVVGTLFAVEASDGATCVSVSHGRVRVAMGVRVAYVGGGQRLCTGEAATAPIEPDVQEALVRHEAVIAAVSPNKAEVAAAAPALDGTASAVAIVTPPAAGKDLASTPAPAPASPGSTIGAGGSGSQKQAPTIGTGDSGSQKQAPTIGIGDSGSQKQAPTIGIGDSERPERQPTIAVGGSGRQERQPTIAPPAPPPAPAPAAPTPPPTAEELYRTAEAALARHDTAAADRALAQLLATARTSPLVDQALYERARIAYQRRAWSEARRDLDQLAAITSTPLAEPGQYLACRIAIEVHDGDAARCLADYRAAYPRSPHELDILGLLAQLASADGGCAAARPYVDDLARRYAKASLTTAWRARCPEAP